MRVVLLNPRWEYQGSIYFGCREPHLPLELGYARTLLEAEGHQVTLLDAHAAEIDDLAAAVAAHEPELLVLTTAPTYLFWRCPPPELRVPLRTLQALRSLSCPKVVVGPHASTSPHTTLRKLEVDAVVLGECEEVVTTLARTPRAGWSQLPSVLCAGENNPQRLLRPASCDMARLPAVEWTRPELARHRHHHHRFELPATDFVGAGAEMETSRGCPFSCSFCAKSNHRDRYRRRPLATVGWELDGLIDRGVSYVYLIDEILLPDRQLLEVLEARPVQFGIQTRIDLWSPDELDLLGRAGCVSIEAGIESVTTEGRQALDKRCRLDTAALSERLIHARSAVPFVQATLMNSHFDDPNEVAEWSHIWRDAGIWVNDPVPLFAYPGSPDYTRLWGMPDERAWERAHEHYLAQFQSFSDIQETRPVRLPVLEAEA